MTIQIPTLKYVPPPTPTDESQRLEELYGLEILDTASNARLDEYTKLVATVLDVPVALVSLVDKERQWFKAAYGLGILETPRETSFCGHAIADGDFLLVPDTLSDARFIGNPFVQNDPKIRFYAGAVIRGPNGHPLGTCCVVDLRPRTLSEREESMLRQIARLVEREIHEEAARRDNLPVSIGREDQKKDLLSSSLFIAAARAAIDAAHPVAQSYIMALVRIDRFEALHAALGNDGTTYLVFELANRIHEALSGECIIGQTREDKVSVLIPVKDEERSKTVIDRLLRQLVMPIQLDTHSVPIRISIGASRFPKDAQDADDLLKRARTALWSRAVSDNSGYCLYERRQSNSASKRFKIETAIRRGLDNNEFELAYQPKISIGDRKLVGAEALLRWHSKTLGTVPPASFIPVAEDCGLISELGSWVLAAACRQIAQWRASGFACPQVAVNVTSSQLREPGFSRKLECHLKDNGLEGDSLDLELTESSLVEDLEGAVLIMQELRKLGITLSLDDFGTGFSSLSYLRKMPIHTLKIDRSFVVNLHEYAEDRKLIRSIISLGHDLGLEVVAEGVETPRQLAFLTQAGCDQVQGYIYAPPLSSEEFRKFMSSTDSDDYRLTTAAP